MKRLKIAVVLGQFPTVSETFIVNQIAFLKEAGHHIDIFCLGKKNEDLQSNTTIEKYKLMDNAFVFKWRDLMPLNKIERIIKVKFTLVNSLGSPAFVNLIKSFNPIKYGIDALNCNQFFRTYYKDYFLINHYDVIHIHFADNAVKLSNHLKNFKNKIVVTFHGYDAHNFDKPFFHSLQKLNNVAYTVNTEFIKQKVINLDFPKEKIKVLPVGLDTSFFKPNAIAHTKFNILFVGRLIELKAPLLAIKIIKKLVELDHQNIHLNIIGDGEEYAICNDFIKKNQLSNFVSLLGNQSQKEIITYMNLTDVLLLPGIVDKNGRCEAQGLVVQEAQAMEIPVVVSSVGGIKEGIIEGKSGYIIEENNIDDYVNCIIKFIHNPSKKIKMGAAGRVFVEDNYDSSVLGKRLLDVYCSDL